jgi:predicted enzyme related to lactoylglutathione lyase
VDDDDARHRAALDAGAREVMPPRDFPGVGRGATLVDPTGALVSIWKGLQGDRPDAPDTPVGDWVWNELATPDPAKALAFYESVFGYAHEDMDLGGEGRYHILKSADGVARGGIMKTPHDAQPAMWVPYVRVEDADAIASRVAPLGGRLLLAPTRIENVGRVGMLADPLGAPLGFVTTEVTA